MMRAVLGAAVVMMGGFVALAGQTPTPTPASTASSSGRAIPAGTMYNVLLQTALSSDKAKADQPFNAGNLEDWKIQNQVVVEAGSTIHGFVSSVRPMSQQVGKAEAEGIGQLTLAFNEVVVGEKSIKLRAAVVAVLDPRRKPDDDRRSSTANVVGGDGSFGLPLYSDVAVSRGGGITAAGGGEVKLPVGIVLRIRLSQALEFPSIHQ